MKILFIGSRLFDDVAWYLKENNITSIITESNENAANLELADKQYIVKRGMDEPMQIAIKEDVDAIIPLIGIDPPLIDVGAMKDKLEKENNIPVIAANHKLATLAADKYETKKLLEKNQIKTPHYEQITPTYNLEDLYDNLPKVLKTPDGQGGIGVKIALTPEDCDEFIESKTNIFTEDYIEGYETSIEVLRYNNQTIPLTPVYKGITTLKGTHPLAKIKQAPLKIDNIDNNQHNSEIRNLAQKIADLIDLTGTMDIDILHDTNKNEDYTIELNTRPSGTRYMTAATTDIYPLCQLVDMASSQWSAKNVKKQMKNYVSTEIPVGDFPEDKFEERKYFTDKNSYIVHGPKHYQRVTIRAENYDKLNDLTYELIPEYAKQHNINFKQ